MDGHVEIAQRVADQIAGAIANAQLHSELRAEARLRKSLAQMGRILSSESNPETMYDLLATEVRNLAPADLIVISVVDKESGTLTVKQFSGDMDVSLRPIGVPTPLKNSVTQMIMDPGRGVTLSLEDADEHSDAHEDLARTFESGGRTLLAAPLQSQGSIFGGLYLISTKQQAYSQHDLELVENVSFHISGAIANLELFAKGQKAEAEQRRLARENAIMAEIGRVINLSLEIDEVYERFAELTKSAIHFDRITVTLIDDKNHLGMNSYTSGVRASEWDQDPVWSLVGTQFERLLRDREPIAHGAESIEDFINEFPALEPTIDIGLRSMVAAPLISRNRVIGGLTVRSGR